MNNRPPDPDFWEKLGPFKYNRNRQLAYDAQQMYNYLHSPACLENPYGGNPYGGNPYGGFPTPNSQSTYFTPISTPTPSIYGAGSSTFFSSNTSSSLSNNNFGFTGQNNSSFNPFSPFK